MLSAGLLRAQGVRTLPGPRSRVLRFPQAGISRCSFMTLADQSDLHSISSYRARLKFFARSMAPDSLFKWILTTGPISSDVTNATEVLDLKFRNDKFRASQTIKEWILSGPKVGKERSPQQQLREYAQSPEIERWKKDGYTISPHSFVEP